MALEDSRRKESTDLPGFIRSLALLILALLPADPLRAAISDGLFSIGTARGYFQDVMRASLTGRPDMERAAFIVGHGDGSLSCQFWPPMSRYHQEVFHGGLPPGTVAIIHTHPGDSPRPSADDQFEADRLGIPIYVLTRRDVYKAEPGQRTATAVVISKPWLNDRDPFAGTRCAR